METSKPHAAGAPFDPALRMHYLRAVAQLLSTDAPVAGLWSRLAAPIVSHGRSRLSRRSPPGSTSRGAQLAEDEAIAEALALESPAADMH
jgi:hypothetical protein